MSHNLDNLEIISRLCCSRKGAPGCFGSWYITGTNVSYNSI